MLLFSIILIFLINFNHCEELNDDLIDKNGYIIFCPCMGRFGNQADQFLGALNFAKEVNRTIVLPHWVEYPEGIPTSSQIPFDKYFQVSPLQEFTNVILMNDFMEKIAPKVWPVGNRTAFCYSSRSDEKKSCEAKSGNPFGPYWDNFNVEFDDSVFYGPLSYDIKYGNYPNKWLTDYSAEKYPVIAFTGVPGSFPVEQYNVPLQKYLKWSTEIDSKAMKFLKRENKNNEKIIGIHLRIGMDFERACEYIKEDIKMNFFASPQCIGYNFEHGTLKRDMCYPSKSIMIDQLKNAIEKYEAKYVYIASDNEYMFSDFEKEIDNVKFIKFDQKNPHVDLCILGKVDHAIFNCVSSFSAFAKRERDINEKSSEFWAFNPNDEKQEL